MSITSKTMPRQARVIRTHRPWWARLWRAAYAEYLRWCERTTRDEREAYLDAKMKLGPEYIRNSYRQEELLRVRIADLENS